ncbi:hypothetical protein EDD86DRAFT_253065 [Gorgonomyces haynaldii]|nr:hypothetical protein EDD86DRAFT_253065 [Gorgonomyces haynaldii]
MTSITATGYLEANHLINTQNPLTLFSFTLDAVTIAANLTVLILLQTKIVTSPYSTAISISNVIDILYKLFYILYAYMPSPPIINWCYIFFGYLGFTVNVCVQLEIFKKFVGLAASLLKSKLREYHVTWLQILLIAFYVMAALVSEIIVLFHLGDFGFSQQRWFYTWYYTTLFIYTGFVGLTYLWSSALQIVFMRGFLKNLDSFQGNHLEIKQRMQNLYTIVVISMADVLAAYITFIVGGQFASDEDSALLIAIANSFASLFPVLNMFVTSQMKHILYDALSNQKPSQTLPFTTMQSHGQEITRNSLH